MNYEQKYKEALERARKINSGEGVEAPSDWTVCEVLFPELKESEDEKIRKALISFLKSPFVNESITDEKVNPWIAWLEKQGQNEYDKDMLGAIEYCKKNNRPLEKEHIAWLEKQCEKEEPQVYETENGEVITYSESKGYKVVEPKFKVGDWILIDNPCQIESIDNNGNYIVRYCDAEETHLLSRNFCDSHFHLWTIQDAKDGDVLVSQYNKPFIYNGNRDSFHIGAYCGISVEDRFKVGTEKCHWTEIKNIYPATKEQRNILFSKMKEAVYEWDAEKKELKKIKQNSTWSEEDERAIGIIKMALEHPYDMEGKWDRKFTLDWLKSIKKRCI